MIVEPSTTLEFSDRPLNAATVRVVRLFAAAIDHSVSPGCTTCGAAADAVAAGISRAIRSTSRRLGRTFRDLRGPGWSPMVTPWQRSGNQCARDYDALQAGLHDILSGLAGGRPEAVGAE